MLLIPFQTCDPYEQLPVHIMPYHAYMNREIVKFYQEYISKGSITEPELKEAILTAIRSDDQELLKACLGRIEGDINCNAYGNPMLFAVKEMASPQIISILLNKGFALSGHGPEMNPFNGTPEEILQIMIKAGNIERETALQTLRGNVSYYIDVMSTDYSCYRIPFNIDEEDRYKPTFFSYLDSWLMDFADLLSKEGIEDNELLIKAIIKHPELEESAIKSMTLFRDSIIKEDNLSWFLNIALGSDNNPAFSHLLELADAETLSKIDTYPPTDMDMLEKLFDRDLLMPGTNEGFHAFERYISYETVDDKNEEMLKAIMHPSYAAKRDQYGYTILMNAIINERFEPHLYPIIISTGEMINERDCNGKTALHHLARTEYPECMEDLIALGADPLALDDNGENVLHTLMRNRNQSLSTIEDCMGFLPKELPMMQNNEGQTPIDIFYNRLMEEE